VNEQKDIPRTFLKALRKNLPIEVEGMVSKQGMNCGLSGKKGMKVYENFFPFWLMDRYYYIDPGSSLLSVKLPLCCPVQLASASTSTNRSSR
jgi:hypothetical protein